MLPIALLQVKTVPISNLPFSPYEMLYERTVLTSTYRIETEVQEITRHTINLRQVKKIKKSPTEYGSKILLAPNPQNLTSSFLPGDMVFLKDLERGLPHRSTPVQMDGPIPGHLEDTNYSQTPGNSPLGSRI